MSSRTTATVVTLGFLFVTLAVFVTPVVTLAQIPQNTGGPAAPQNTGGPQVTPAANPANNSGTLLSNPINVTSLPDLLDQILNALVDIGTVVLILAFVWVGFSFVRAQGNPAEIAKARSALIWTVIGGAILLGAHALSDVIKSTVQGL